MTPLEQTTRRAAAVALEAAGRYLWAMMRDLVSFNPGDPDVHSPPGTPPYSHTGIGLQGIEIHMSDEVVGPVAEIGIFPGSDGFYMALHDVGESHSGRFKFPPRPWLSTYETYMPEVLRVFWANFKL